MFYRKKPVTIEARQFLFDTATEGADWCGGDVIEDEEHNVRLYLDINTLEGIMRANLGDYIIKGVRGEFYPCKPDIFYDTYSPETDEKSIIYVDDLVDHEDGSCTIGLTMDSKSMRLFAEVGILKVLTDEARRIIANNDEFDTNVGC